MLGGVDSTPFLQYGKVKPMTICSQPICLYLHWCLIEFDSAVCLPGLVSAQKYSIILYIYLTNDYSRTKQVMGRHDIYIYSLQDVPLDHWVFLSGLFLVGWLLMVSGIQFKRNRSLESFEPRWMEEVELVDLYCLTLITLLLCVMLFHVQE